MKTREVVAISLFGLALLAGCNKSEETTTTPATGSSSETAPAAITPDPTTTAPAPTETAPAPAETSPAEPEPTEAAPATEGQ